MSTYLIETQRRQKASQLEFGTGDRCGKISLPAKSTNVYLKLVRRVIDAEFRDSTRLYKQSSMVSMSVNILAHIQPEY